MINKVLMFDAPVYDDWCIWKFHEYVMKGTLTYQYAYQYLEKLPFIHFQSIQYMLEHQETFQWFFHLCQLHGITFEHAIYDRLTEEHLPYLVLMMKKQLLTYIPDDIFVNCLHSSSYNILYLFLRCQLSIHVTAELVRKIHWCLQDTIHEKCLECFRAIEQEQKDLNHIIDWMGFVEQLQVELKETKSQFHNPTHISWVMREELRKKKEWIKGEMCSRRLYGPHCLILEFLSLG